jgi:hypothetical protein
MAGRAAPVRSIKRWLRLRIKIILRFIFIPIAEARGLDFLFFLRIHQYSL